MSRAAIAAAVLATLAAAPAAAQEHSLFLRCAGELSAGEEQRAAHLHFAMRQNNRLALIEASNVLPAGEQLRYVPTPSRYVMSYLLPRSGVTVLVLPGWFHSTILARFANLERLDQVRLSIDRHSGELEGELLGPSEAVLGTLRMRCEPGRAGAARPRL